MEKRNYIDNYDRGIELIGDAEIYNIMKMLSNIEVSEERVFLINIVARHCKTQTDALMCIFKLGALYGERVT